MLKITFIHPILLFILWCLFLTFTALLLSVGTIYWPSPAGFIFSYLGNFFALILFISWPLAVYKYISGQPETIPSRNPKKFDKTLIATFFLVPAILVLAAVIEHSQFSQLFDVFLNVILMVVILGLYVPIIRLVWASAKMLKGGIGWFIVILYWPLTGVFVQGRIRKLYPLRSLN